MGLSRCMTMYCVEIRARIVSSEESVTTDCTDFTDQKARNPWYLCNLWFIMFINIQARDYPKERVLG